MSVPRYDLTSFLRAAQDGPLVAAKLVPLNDIGPLRVAYNWLYSALNCDPGDSNEFGWVISKIGSGPQVSLSPRDAYDGMTLYASVRPDNAMFVEVQAAGSGDWITAIGSDETLTITELGFLTISLQAFDGSYLCMNPNETEHDGYSAYKMQSNAGSVGPASSFFVAVQEVLQPNVKIPLARELDASSLETALADLGATNPGSLAEKILSDAR